MPTIKISKIKVRRGTDAQRKTVIFDQGELAHTLDTKRLFIGDGVTIGGNVVGSKIHSITTNYYTLSTINAEVNDIVNVNNKFYQLTASNYSNINSWADVGTKINSSILNYNSSNQLDVNTNSISAKYLANSTITNGLSVINNNLQVNYNTKFFEISGLQLSLKAAGIDEREINKSSLSNGLTGGSGDKLKLNVNSDYFYFDTNGKLSLSSNSIYPLSLQFTDLDSAWFGDGLNYNSLDETITSTLVDVDGVSIVNTSGTISVKNGAVTGTNQLAQITVDEFGRVTNQVSSIYGALTGNASLSSFNVSNSLSAIFNGSPSQTLSGAVPGLKLTNFTATDQSGATVTLSSAGFITFEGPTTTRNGSKVGRFAIPIFSY
jgi:hypothetical protein